MAETGIMNQKLNFGQAYEQSFGNLPHEMRYQELDAKSLLISGKEPSYRMDARPILNRAAQVGMKALTSQAGGAGTAGYAMFPVFVDPEVIDRTRKYHPLVEIVPRVTNRGMYADYNVVTAKGGGFTANEDGTMTEQDNTFDRASTAIKFLYAKGRVTGPAMAGMPSYVLVGMSPQGGASGAFTNQTASNAKQVEILLQTQALRELEEKLIVNGNATTSVYGGPDGSEFDGIVQLMSTTNTVDKSSAAIGLNDLNTAVRYAFDDSGRPNLGICSSAVYEDLLSLLTAKIGYLNPQVQVFWGFSTIVYRSMVGDIPILASQYLSNTTGSKSLYFLDLSVVEMRVLLDMTYEEKYSDTDSYPFLLKIYETLIIKATSFCASITNIA